MTSSNPMQRIKPSMFFASFFGAGFFPVAPGTAGSIIAAAIFLLAVPERYRLHAAVALFIAGIFIVRRTSSYLTNDDDQRIVIDEAAGVWLALSLAPDGLWNAAATVALFRFFDVVKPLGIKKIQKLPYEWGIMLDDTSAGILSVAVLKAAEAMISVL
ncbi:MAG: phosphatidylglycerophosphatase A [Endomicrobiia bacterium]|nr:phosphatidylglycerophosphatase A [Endomicrobiia bacterium]